MDNLRRNIIDIIEKDKKDIIEYQRLIKENTDESNVWLPYYIAIVIGKKNEITKYIRVAKEWDVILPNDILTR